MKKPSHVLSPRPFVADAVHAVVPVADADQRQAVRAAGDADVDGAHGSARRRCRAPARRSAGRTIRLRLRAAARRPGTAPRRRAAPTSPVVRTYSATTNGSHSMSSEQRLRRPRPDGSCHQCCTSPSTNCRAGRAQDVLARDLRRGMQQRQHVLQLIAEAVGAAGLVIAGAAPDAAGQRLIHQPPVHHRVERIVRRAAP